MTIESVMEGCLVMMEGCRKINDATATAVTELLARLEEKDTELEEQRVDNTAMKEWGGRVEARRAASARKDEAVRAILTKQLSDEREDNTRLRAKIVLQDAAMVVAEEEMVRLREEALETCNVSRTIMLQNSHTRMEREMELMREATAKKSPPPSKRCVVVGYTYDHVQAGRAE